jgi:hypothetical protein
MFMADVRVPLCHKGFLNKIFPASFLMPRMRAAGSEPVNPKFRPHIRVILAGYGALIFTPSMPIQKDLTSTMENLR